MPLIGMRKQEGEGAWIIFIFKDVKGYMSITNLNDTTFLSKLGLDARDTFEDIKWLVFRKNMGCGLLLEAPYFIVDFVLLWLN